MPDDPTGFLPDDGPLPAAPAASFLTGVQGQWHAVPVGGLAYAARTDDGTLTIAQACCGDLVRVAPKYETYNRGSVPVAHDPCQTCAWTVAALTGQLEVEIGRLTPVGTVRTAMARVMRDPDIAVTAAARILDAARGPGCPDGPADPATIQLLAAIAQHAPVLLINEECGEGDCDHDDGPCTFQGGAVACAACSLINGEWAGEWQGGFRPECRIGAPCQVLDELVQAAAEAATAARDGVVARAQEIAREES